VGEGAVAGLVPVAFGRFIGGEELSEQAGEAVAIGHGSHSLLAAGGDDQVEEVGVKSETYGFEDGVVLAVVDQVNDRLH
jgi:hypothetical protein